MLGAFLRLLFRHLLRVEHEVITLTNASVPRHAIHPLEGVFRASQALLDCQRHRLIKRHARLYALFLAARPQADTRANVHLVRPLRRVNLPCLPVHANGEGFRRIAHHAENLHAQPTKRLGHLARNGFLDLLTSGLHHRGACRGLIDRVRVQALVHGRDAGALFALAGCPFQHAKRLAYVEAVLQRLHSRRIPHADGRAGDRA